MEKHFGPTELVKLLATIYSDKPDDYAVSVCHWQPVADCFVPTGLPKGVLQEAIADLRLTVGGIKKMLDPTYPYEE